MQKWLKKWRRLQDTQKNQSIILALAVAVVMYTFLFYGPGKKDMQWSQNMLNRQTDRMQKVGQREVADLPNVSALQIKMKRLKINLESARVEAQRYQLRQAPLDDGGIMQNLRVGITNLALESGVRVISSKNAGIAMKKDEAPDSEEAQKSQVKNAFGRPQVALKASATFGQLMDFLNGLPGLDYEVSVARLGMQIEQNDKGNYRDETFNASNVVLLDLDLLLAL